MVLNCFNISLIHSHFENFLNPIGGNSFPCRRLTSDRDGSCNDACSNGIVCLYPNITSLNSIYGTSTSLTIASSLTRGALHSASPRTWNLPGLRVIGKIPKLPMIRACRDYYINLNMLHLRFKTKNHCRDCTQKHYWMYRRTHTICVERWGFRATINYPYKSLSADRIRNCVKYIAR